MEVRYLIGGLGFLEITYDHTGPSTLIVAVMVVCTWFGVVALEVMMLKVINYILLFCVVVFVSHYHGIGVGIVLGVLFFSNALNDKQWNEQYRCNLEACKTINDCVNGANYLNDKFIELDVAVKEVERDVDLINQRVGDRDGKE